LIHTYWLNMLRKWFKLAEPQFPHLQNGNNLMLKPRAAKGFNEIMSVKHVAQCLPPVSILAMLPEVLLVTPSILTVLVSARWLNYS
jgi:hypothetical protein